MHNEETVDGEHVQAQTPSASKRALLKSAWIAPMIVAVTLPRSGYAANISGGGDGGDGKAKSNNGNHFGQPKKDG